MRRAFHLRWPLLCALSASGCLAIDWGSYHVAGDVGASCAVDGGAGTCEAVPEGWTVLRAQVVGDPSMPPGTCAGGSPQTVYFTEPAGPPTCSPCGCTLNAAAKCSAPEITCFYGNLTCSGAADFTDRVKNAGCLDITMGVPAGADLPGSCKISGPPVRLKAACDFSGGDVTATPLWGGAVFACAVEASPDSCAPGNLCLPEAESPDGPLCIFRPGTHPCPAGWEQAIAAFDGGVDHRSCTACDCDISCSGGGYVVHDLAACGDSSPPVAVNASGCKAAPNLFDLSSASLVVTLGTPALAACSGGKPQGQVDGNPVQICCK